MTRHLLETATLVLAALLIGVIGNAAAARERKLSLPGYWPNATTVPERSTEPLKPITTTATPTTTVATATTAPIPAPPVPTATTATTATVAPPTATTTTTTTAPPKPGNPGTPEPPATPPPVEDLLTKFPPHETKPYIELHGDDVAWLHARGVLFLDARRTSVYEQGHIAGARSFSIWEADVDDKVAKLYEERSDPREQLQPIVVYCSGGACEDSHMLSQKLWGLSFNNVYVYKDGFPDWQQRGGATKTGGAP